MRNLLLVIENNIATKELNIQFGLNHLTHTLVFMLCKIHRNSILSGLYILVCGVHAVFTRASQHKDIFIKPFQTSKMERFSKIVNVFYPLFSQNPQS